MKTFNKIKEQILIESNQWVLGFDFTVDYTSKEGRAIQDDLITKFKKIYSGSGSGGSGFDVSFQGPKKEIDKAKKYVESKYKRDIDKKYTNLYLDESVKLDEASQLFGGDTNIPADKKTKGYIESGRAKILMNVQSSLHTSARFVVAKNPNTGSNQDKVLMFTISDPDRGRIKMFAFHGSHVSHQKAMDFAKRHKLVAKKDAKGNPLYAKESVELDEAKVPAITFEFPDERRARQFDLDIENSAIGVGDQIGNRVTVTDVETRWRAAVKKAMIKSKGTVVKESVEEVDEIVFAQHKKLKKAGGRQLKDPRTEVMVVDEKGKVIVIDRKDLKKYEKEGWELAESVELDERLAYHHEPDARMRKGIESGKYPMVASKKSILGGNTLFGVFQFTGKAAGGGPEPGTTSDKGMRYSVDGYVMAIVDKKNKVLAYYGSHPSPQGAIDKYGRFHGLIGESVELDERLSDREMDTFSKAHTALHTKYHKQALQIIKFIDSVEKHKQKWVDSFGDYVTPKMNPELALSNPNSVEYQQGRGRGDWSFLIGHGKVRYNNRDMPWNPKSGELPFDKFMKLLDTWKSETLRESVELDEVSLKAKEWIIVDRKTGKVLFGPDSHDAVEKQAEKKHGRRWNNKLTLTHNKEKLKVGEVDKYFKRRAESVEVNEATKWKMGDGRPRGGSHIENIRFWDLTKDELEYIIKDAGKAMKANPKARKATTGPGNWADQVNDAHTVLGWRKKNGIKESVELDEAKAWDNIVKIQQDHTAKKIHGMLVDAQTANALITVHDALKKSGNKKTFIDTINKNKAGLVKMVDFAWKQVSFK